VLFGKKIASLYILFEKYIGILVVEIASPGNQHRASYVGTLSFRPSGLKTKLPGRRRHQRTRPEATHPGQPSPFCIVRCDATSDRVTKC